MKKLIAVTALTLLAQPAMSLDWTEKNSRDVYDLMYLPNAGTTFGQTTFNSTAGKAKAETDTGVKIADVETKSTRLEQAFGHSITDRLSLFATIDHLFNSETEVDYASPLFIDGKTESKGLGDPTLSLRYRILDQADSRVNFDIIPEYTFDSGDAKSGTTEDDGNNKYGGSFYGATLQVGKKFPELQFTVYTSFLHDNEVESKDATTKEKTKDEGHNFYIIGGQFLRNLSEKWMFSANVRYQIEDSYKSKDEDGSFTDRPILTTLILSPEVIYAASESLAFFVRLDLIATDDYKTKDENGIKTKYEENSSANFAISARYQF